MDLIYRMRAEFERSDHPQKSIEELRRIVVGVAEDGPAREGILFSASFLAALADYTNPQGLPLLNEYMEDKEALDLTLEQVRQNMEAAWTLWRAAVDKRKEPL